MAGHTFSLALNAATWAGSAADARSCCGFWSHLYDTWTRSTGSDADLDPSAC